LIKKLAVVEAALAPMELQVHRGHRESPGKMALKVQLVLKVLKAIKGIKEILVSVESKAFRVSRV
jgi:hypothetical protein